VKLPIIYTVGGGGSVYQNSTDVILKI